MSSETTVTENIHAKLNNIKERSMQLKEKLYNLHNPQPSPEVESKTVASSNTLDNIIMAIDNIGETVEDCLRCTNEIL